MEWLRLYSEFATDPKVQSMSEAMQRRLIMLFCLKVNDQILSLTEDEIAFHLHISPEELAETKSLFIKKKFINQKWQILNWNKRQYISDNSIVRVKKYRNERKKAGLPINGYLKHKNTVFERDNFACVYCNSKQNLCIDHILPVALGGNDDLENVATCCKRCNSNKAGRTPQLANFTFFNQAVEFTWKKWLSEKSVTVTQECVTVSVTAPDTDTDTDTYKKKKKEKKVSPSGDVGQARRDCLGEVKEIFEHWQKVMNHPRASLDEPSKRKMLQRLKSFDKVQLMQAVSGCAVTPWNMGENPGGQVYDGLGLIFRDDDHVRRFLRNADENQKKCQKFVEGPLVQWERVMDNLQCELRHYKNKFSETGDSCWKNSISRTQDEIKKHLENKPSAGK